MGLFGVGGIAFEMERTKIQQALNYVGAYPAKISMEATEVNKILNVSLFGVGTYNVGLQTSPIFIR